jgi:FkbM family methyltransferase
MQKFPPWSGNVPSGMRVTYYGSLMRDTFYGPNRNRPSYHQTPIYPAIDEELYEWIDLLEAIDTAVGRFTMIELGAGFGRWLVAGGCTVRRQRPMPMMLIGAEAEPHHFTMMEQHFSDNGIPPDEYVLINRAVNGTGEPVHFTVGHPEAWYGQAIVPEGTELADWPESKTVRVQAVTLASILEPLDKVDLIDIDVQGTEAEIIEASLGPLASKVCRLHIGTHSHEVEERLRKSLGVAGWIKLRDYPCQTTIETEFGPIWFGDGVQSWVNSANPPG